MKTYVVFGASGSIGSAIVRQLLAGGHRVIFAPRNGEHTNDNVFREGLLGHVTVNVTDRKMVELYGISLQRLGKVDGIIYSVGHCPPDGFPEAIKHPLSTLPLEVYKNEIGMHQLGVFNVFQCLLDNLVDGGSFVFLSSAITRFDVLPTFLHVYHHVSVIAGEDWLIKGMRADPTVGKRGINIHRIAPSAVDTPFHRTGPQPAQFLSTEEVAKVVVEALKSESHVDTVLLPK